jgi:hypothetical protein
MQIPTNVIDITGGIRDDTAEDRDRLAISLTTFGLLQPIVACPNPEVPGRYLCIAGRRRLLAGRRLAWPSIECHVVEADESTREQIEITENLQRVELTPLDRARAFRRLVDLWTEANPDAGATLWARYRTRGTPAPAIAEVAKQVGVSPRTVRRMVAAAPAADAFTPDQRAVIDVSGISAPRAAAVAAIEDEGRRDEVLALLATNMSYPDAMREVLGDAYEGDEEEDNALADDEFLATCPIRSAVNQARFDSDALLYRRVAVARRRLARDLGWGKLKAEVGQGQRGPYFARMAWFLEAPPPQDWLQCHDCARGKTQHGDCRKCGGGGYRIG